MKVGITEFFRQELLEIGDDPEHLIKEFVDWKARGPAGEDNHYYFGKDAEYREPVVNGKRVLRHVHLVPLTGSRYSSAWDRAWHRGRGKRVSDTALVYADGGRHGYLLLTILWEPTAHSIAEMSSPEDRNLMLNLAEIAEQFIFNGTCDV